MPPAKTILTTCTGCGATCDDIVVEFDGEGLVSKAKNACPLGEQWFELPAASGPVAVVEGQPVDWEHAVRVACEILKTARVPLVAGLTHATTEAIQAACELADRLGACIDWTISGVDRSGTLALQTAGGVTASLGEVAQRADLVLLWGSDLATTHPRHFERYTLDPASPWLPKGRADRTLFVVDDRTTESMSVANGSLQITTGSDFEAFTMLRALLAQHAVDANVARELTGVELSAWQELAAAMAAARFATVVIGKRLAAAGPEVLVELTNLVADLTAYTRCVTIAEGGPGNATGAANVLAWQTGFPLGMNFAKGYPQYGPDEWTTDQLLARREADAALIVADDLATHLSVAAAEHLANVPSIALDWRETDTTRQAKVAFHIARPGVACGGTTYRADGIALPLRAVVDSERPTAQTILRKIIDGLTAQSSSSDLGT